MFDGHDARDLIEQSAYSRDGERIGTIQQVFFDDDSGAPEFLAVKTGLVGNDRLVPLAESSPREGGVTLPYSTQEVKDGPKVQVVDGHRITDEAKERLHVHYGR